MIISIKKCIIPACEGADHKWEFERPTLREVKRMQQHGVDISLFEDAMNVMLQGGSITTAIDALLALVDILHRRDGARIPFEDIDVDFPTLDFEFGDDEIEPGDDAAGEGEEGKAGPAPTSSSQPPAAEEPAGASDSGPPATEASTPKSPPTALTSGGGTA